MANPIASVDGVTVPCPSSYKYDLQDISDSDAGRTEDISMDKKRLGQCVKLELSWKYIDTATVSQILQCFNPEYIIVNYLDALSGSYRSSEFYVGDRSAPMYNATLGLWESVAFNIIERKGVER